MTAFTKLTNSFYFTIKRYVSLCHECYFLGTIVNSCYLLCKRTYKPTCKYVHLYFYFTHTLLVVKGFLENIPKTYICIQGCDFQAITQSVFETFHLLIINLLKAVTLPSRYGLPLLKIQKMAV